MPYTAHLPAPSRSAWIVSGGVLAIAAANAGAWLASAPVDAVRPFGARVADLPAAEAVTVSSGHSGLATLALLLLAGGLLRRRRTAWALTCLALGAALVLGGLHHESGRELAPVAAAGAMIVASRRKLVAEPYREVLGRGMAPPEQRAALAADLVAQYGADTLAPFKVRKDVGHLFSRTGDAVLAYRIEYGALVVASDPVGSTAGRREVMARALQLAQHCGLRFGVAAASAPLAAELSERFGLRSIYMGCEAVVDPRDFSLSGHKIKKVRQAHRRVQRAGIEFDITPLSELSAPEVHALTGCHEAGRGDCAEQSFSMAPDDLESACLAGALTIRARHADGRVAGALLVMPVPRAHAWTLALQSRDPQSPNGVIDALIAHLLLEAPGYDVERVSLNFAAARRYVHEPVSGFWPHLARRLALLAMRWTQIDSLRAHNDKFSPSWEPRFMLCDGALQLPRVAFATIWQEGQLPRPSVLLTPAWPAAAAPQRPRRTEGPAPRAQSAGRSSDSGR